jgi:hypothetical protein
VRVEHSTERFFFFFPSLVVLADAEDPEHLANELDFGIAKSSTATLAFARVVLTKLVICLLLLFVCLFVST